MTKKNINWELIDPLLGTVPDRELAEKTGCTINLIGARRRLKKIKAFRESQLWGKYKKELGLVPDADIAKRMGLTNTAVATKRRSLQIPAHKKKRDFDWEQIDPLLGTMPDIDLAKKNKCSVSLINHRRAAKGIAPFLIRIDWSKYDHLLGQQPDHQLAHLIGCTMQNVYKRRRQLGIQPYSPPKPRRTLRVWLQKKYPHILREFNNARVCIFCGEEFYVPPSSNQKTCSEECRTQQRIKSHLGNSFKWSEEKKKRLSETRDMTELREKAIQAIKTSPTSGPFETNRNAKKWVIQDPEGIIYRIRNLNLFLRENAIRLPGTVAQARTGLTNVKRSYLGKLPRPVTQWKGWRLVWEEMEHMENNDETDS